MSNDNAAGVSALRSNTTYSVIAMCLSALSMVITLKLLLHFTNTELFGLWSLTVGMLAFSRAGDISGSGSLSRFVARESKSAEHQIAFIDTVLIFTFVFYCVLLLVIAAPLSSFLKSQVPFELHHIGENLLFISMLILILNVLGVSQMSAIDGLYESVTRSKIQIFSSLVLCVSSYPLIRGYGVYGYAFSITLQHFLNLVISRVVLKKRISGLSFFPVNFSRGKLREITTFGLKVQGQSIAGLFYDPLAKLLVNNYAGLSGVAVYDIAYKLASYCQLVLVAACNPLLPILSGFNEGSKEKKKQYFYIFLMKFLKISCGPVILASLLVPVASLLFFEELKIDFIICTLFLMIAWYTSSIANISSIYAQSEGMMKWNIIGSLSIACFLVPMIIITAEIGGSDYAAIGTSFAIFSGSLVLMFGNFEYFELNQLSRLVNIAILVPFCMVFSGIMLQIWWWL